MLSAALLLLSLAAPPGPPLLADWRCAFGPHLGAAARGFRDGGWPAVHPPATVWRRGSKGEVWCRAGFDGQVLLPAGGTAMLALGSLQGEVEAFLDGRPLCREQVAGRPLDCPLPAGLRRGRHDLAVHVTYNAYAGGLIWGATPTISSPPGAASPTDAQQAVLADPAPGLSVASYESAVDHQQIRYGFYRPPAAAGARLPLLVWLHGWDGSIYSFAAWRPLFDLARQRGVLLLFPDARGNRLYTGDSERSVLETIDQALARLPADPDAVHLAGISMGGAGALQLAYHRPDRFASVAAFFGDSFYPLSGYLGRILRTRATAEAYSVLWFAENSLALPTMLVHGRDDRVSLVLQSERLAARLRELQHPDLVADLPTGFGHEAALVLDRLPALFDWALTRRRVDHPPLVRYAASDPDIFPGAYGVRLVPARRGTFGRAAIHLFSQENLIVVEALENGALQLDPLRLGLDAAKPIRIEAAPGLLLEQPVWDEGGRTILVGARPEAGEGCWALAPPGQGAGASPGPAPTPAPALGPSPAPVPVPSEPPSP